MPPKLRSSSSREPTVSRPIRNNTRRAQSAGSRQNDEETLKTKTRNATIINVEKMTGVRFTQIEKCLKKQKRLDTGERKLVERMETHELFINQISKAKDKSSDIHGFGGFVELPPSPQNSPRFDYNNDPVDNLNEYDDEPVQEHTNNSDSDDIEVIDVESASSQYDSPLEFEQGPTWLEPTLKDDYSSPGLIYCDQDPETFIKNDFQDLLTEIFSKITIHPSMDAGDKKRREDPNPHIQDKVVGKDEDEHFFNTMEAMTEYACQQHIVKTVLNSNVEEFFDVACEMLKLYDPTMNKCAVGCFCNIIMSFKRQCPTLLHTAAGVSTVEFIEAIIVEDFYTNSILKRGLDQIHVNHYKKQIYSWLGTESRETLPIMVALENKRVDVVNMMLSVWIDKYQIRLLVLLVYHSILDQIDEEPLLKMAKAQKNKFLTAAFECAARIGDPKTIKLLEELFNTKATIECTWDYKYREQGSNVENNEIVPGRLLTRGKRFFQTPSTVRCEPPFVHWLAEYGHFDLFNDMEVRGKRAADRFMWTALASLLEFSDEQVRTQLFTFRSVCREDQFFFISQVIIRNRMGLLEEALGMVYSNPDNFKPVPNKNGWYGTCGLPSAVPLPMETVLSRTGDFVLLDRIANFYSRQDKFTKRMIEEDALRCIRSIQDKAFRCTEHIRLAVIYMMMKFIELKSSGFKDVMRMYSNQNKQDRVEIFIFENYIKKEFARYQPNVRYVTWQAAFDAAREVITNWEDASFEGRIPANLSQARNLSKGKPVEKREHPSILMTKERLEQKRQLLKKTPRTERDVAYGLMKALEEIRNL